LTSGIKKKSHVWLFHVASVVMLKKQDGDNKKFSYHIEGPDVKLSLEFFVEEEDGKLGSVVLRRQVFQPVPVDDPALEKKLNNFL
jgi:hypothetical protein